MAPGASDRLLTRGFASLLLAQVGFGYAFSSYFLLPKFVVVALDGGPREIGLLTAVHNAVVFALMPAMGALVDRFGRRRFLTAGALLMAAASLLFTTIDAFGPAIFALRAVQALAFAMAFAAGSALAVDEAPPDRVAQAIGLFGLTFLSMNAVAPLLVEEVSVRAGWPAAFGLAAAGALLCALLSLRLRERVAPDGPGEPLVGLVAVATRPSLQRVMVVTALVGIAFSSIFNFHQPFAIEAGMERLRAFFAAYAVVAIGVRVGFGSWIDRFGHRRSAIAALSLYVAVALLASEIPRAGLALLGAALGLAHGVFYPAFNAVALERAGPRERGKVMALHQAAFQAGGAVGPIALGLLAERAGYPPVFYLCALCLALALVVLVSSPEGRQRRLDAGAAGISTGRDP
jgi:MFS family permease